MIAKIAVAAANFAIDKPYSYRIPYGMLLRPGIRVMVPFGRGNRATEGIVLSVEEGRDDGLKAVCSALDETPLLNGTMLRLASFMRQRYFCTMYDAIRTMLPAGLWFRSQDSFCLTEDSTWRSTYIRQSHAKLLLEHLHALGGQAKEDALREVVPEEEDFHKAVQYLLKKKL